MSKLQLATVFSGIGAVEQALNKMNIEYNIVFACDNGERQLDRSYDEIVEEIKGMNNEEKNAYIKNLYDSIGKQNYVKKSYFANYNIDESRWYEDIRFIDGYVNENKVDLLVGGSPCQSFSICGRHGGLEDARGTLFYEYARIVKEIKPKAFIYENVPGMLSHDNGMTWKIISSIFDELGYTWKLFKLNAKDHGIPQNRRRIYVVGFRNDFNVDVDFDIKTEELTKKVEDYLEQNVDEKYYYKQRGFEWITKPTSLKRRVSINSDIARTLSANQQFNWCGDMRFEPVVNKTYSDKVYVGEYEGIKGVARKLTPRECLRLMGFSEDFKIVVPDTQIYRQSGNSIVVNVLEKILKNIIDKGILDMERRL